jgi:hypothetical protein
VLLKIQFFAKGNVIAAFHVKRIFCGKACKGAKKIHESAEQSRPKDGHESIRNSYQNHNINSKAHASNSNSKAHSLTATTNNNMQLKMNNLSSEDLPVSLCFNYF